MISFLNIYKNNFVCNMDPNTLAQLNEAYQKGVYTSEESLEVDTELQEWVEALIEEGYDLDEYTDEEIYEINKPIFSTSFFSLN